MPTVSPATCLGCGCACDDIRLEVDANRIVEAGNACSLGREWFGDGRAPARARIDGRDAPLDEAIDAAARLLARSVRPLVYLAADLTCEAQREAVAIADALNAVLDTVTSATVLGSVLAQQERGRASATLGEIRNRSDLVVFWGVDPAARYPRYSTRYAPDPAGVHVPDGRASRTVVAVDVGALRGPADADRRIAVDPRHEVAVLTMVTDAVTREGPQDVSGVWAVAAALDAMLRAGRYLTIVADAEPDDRARDRDPGRSAALIALAQALNGRTRCALSLLRAGGNRSGCDAVLTWQTGYPTSVDFTRGYPRYLPHETARAPEGRCDAAIVIGSAFDLPERIAAALGRIPCALVGPRASETAPASVHVAIDTGVAGVHESGTAFRMDDVPVPVSEAVSGPPAAREVLGLLRGRVAGSRRPAGAEHPSNAEGETSRRP